MSIATVVTRGYSIGSANLVVTRGYSIGEAVVVVTPTATTSGGGRYRYFTPVPDTPAKKKKRKREPEIVVKEDVVIETVYVDWAGMVGSVEQIKEAMLDEEKRLEARRKRARNKALILMMLQ